MQLIPPRLDRELQERETFGCPCVFTPLCSCKPHLQLGCVDIYLFIFPLPAVPGEGGPPGQAALDMSTLLLSSAASPGYL